MFYISIFMDQRPCSHQHTGKYGPALKSIHDHKVHKAHRDRNTNGNRQASDSQERTRVENMDPETFATPQETRTCQEDVRVQIMDPEEEYAH